MTRTTNRFDRRKMTAALFGGGALIAMAVVGVTSAGVGSAPVVNVSGSMMIGATTTVTYTGTVAPVVAKPLVKAKPYSG